MKKTPAHRRKITAFQSAMEDIDELQREFVWNEYSDYPRSDWKRAVNDNATCLGYWDWVRLKASEEV